MPGSILLGVLTKSTKSYLSGFVFIISNWSTVFGEMVSGVIVNLKLFTPAT